MKTKFFLAITCFILVGLSQSICAQPYYNDRYELGTSLTNNYARITFNNQSDYYMTLKIIHSYGGLYTTVSLPPYEARSVSFSSSGTFKLKIKATSNWSTSYHDGGNFSVTCNQYEWTEGEMVFKMSSYGSGLGPSISSREFESNY